MTPQDISYIRMSYREAPDKPHQITILSQLNDCTKDDIKAIVKDINPKNNMCRLYDSGMIDKLIAARCGCSTYYVFKWRKDNKLPSNWITRVAFKEEDFRRMYESGMNDHEMESESGVPRYTVRNWRKENGLASNFKAKKERMVV